METFLYFILFIGFIYGYYKLCKWLTYDWFQSEEPYQSMFSKVLGVILLLPFAILFLFILAASKNNSDSSSSSYRKFDDDDENEGYYQAQVRGGTTWLNVGGPRNEAGAMSSVDYEKSRNPSKQYRVVRKNSRGKIIGTVYSC